MKTAPFWLLGAAGLFSAAALDRRYDIQRYLIRSARIPAGTPRTRLAVLADLHSEPRLDRRERLMVLLMELRPDAIVLPGDIVDERRSLPGVAGFLRRMSAVAPVYASLGNHEGRVEAFDDIRRTLTGAGVRLLQRDWVRVGGILLAGLDDPAAPWTSDEQDWALEARLAFAPLRDEKAFRVLLSHRPDRVRDYASLPFDLVLSGHAHGGQVRLPHLAPGGLYAPNQGILPRWTGGLYRHGQVLHVVSRGLALKRLPRVWNRPEVTAVDLAAPDGTLSPSECRALEEPEL